MNTQARRKVTRIGMAATAVALVAGSAGGGALLTAQSSLDNNTWETKASQPTATVTVNGAPFDAHLNATDTTAARTWTITNNSKTQAATVSGVFSMKGKASANADDVHVVYKHNNSKMSAGGNWKMKDGGTLAHPASFALNDLLSAGQTIAPGQSIDVVVDTAFTDPKTGVDAIDKADFAITYQFQD